MQNSSTDSPAARLKIKPSCILSAALLAVVTVAVFARLQDFGPESTIRKFNMAAEKGDIQGIQNEIDMPISNPDAEKMAAWAHGLLDQGAKVQIQRMARAPDIVKAEVIYILPDGRIVPMILVVKDIGHAWKIDPTASFEAWQALFGIPG